MNQLEKMAERFFEVNRITFSDDDLPEEGAGHNRALHIMVKCEGHYIKGVMINGGSSVYVCLFYTLQQLNIDTNRIRTSNVSIRAFDGSRRDTIGEIELTMTISPVDFNIVFQVLDIETSYNFLFGRPWIHMARAIPSSLHQMVKFEYDRQEIVVHGEDDSSIYKDPSIPCIEAKEGCESVIYQAFEVIEVDQVEEGKPILHPRLSATSMMVASLMLRNGYEPGKGLGSSLQGIVNPIAPFSKKDTFGLGFNPTPADRAKSRKENGWNLSKPIPHIAYSFIKPQFEEVQNPSTQDDIDEVCQGLKEMFYEINMVQVGEGPSHASVQLIVSRRGIELDHSKIKTIRELPSPKNKTEVMSLLGRLNNISRFITQLTTTCEPIFKLLKKNAAIKWTDKYQEAFDKIKEYLSNPPILVPPEPGRPLFLYLSVMDSSFGCVLGQHDATGKRE
ncbi:uncharacterized protein LOC142180094 [Nicotiana tabacum]|uniref:Uncharacterized protein LOC142180094 n=1 Tax=Nicotiana tabacum TaxID=4097 RepID=A0AC58UD04_TOBAC